MAYIAEIGGQVLPRILLPSPSLPSLSAFCSAAEVRALVVKLRMELTCWQARKSHRRRRRRRRHIDRRRFFTL